MGAASSPELLVIAAPAVDLRQGRCVQLVGGRPEEERVSLPDPVATALQWWEMGFGTLHVVDLDAALGEGDNTGIIAAIAQASPATLQVGGGIRDHDAAERALALGAHRIVVGTRAVEDPLWLGELAERHPGGVMVAADIRAGRVLSKGWTESTELRILEFLDSLEGLPLAGVLCTDVAREGKVQGVDPVGARRVIHGSSHPVWISGGVTTENELEALSRAGAAGAVLGMALYTGVLSGARVAERFGFDNEGPEAREAPAIPKETGR